VRHVDMYSQQQEQAMMNNKKPSLPSTIMIKLHIYIPIVGGGRTSVDDECTIKLQHTEGIMVTVESMCVDQPTKRKKNKDQKKKKNACPLFRVEFVGILYVYVHLVNNQKTKNKKQKRKTKKQSLCLYH
jgi:hypothetical protein